MNRPTVVFLVNGGPDSAMGIRASAFASRLQAEFDIDLRYRGANKVYAILQNLACLLRRRPAVCYVFDMGFSGVLAAGIYRALSRGRVVIDTGDAIYDLSRITGSRGPVGLWLTKRLEKYALAISDRVIVRSHPHQEMLASQGINAEAVPDGVDVRQFSPHADNGLRRKLGLEGYFVVGLLGSVTWNPKLKMCYGWEVLEVVHRLRDRPVKGLVIGDGTGLAHLKARCAALGILDRVVFAGRLAYEELPPYLNLMDVCLSTQTNDSTGQVRTGGKLPLYLACGRFVLATDVGEAARVLPPAMLVKYVGTTDLEYPVRLTERLQDLLQHPEDLQERAESIAIAKANFDYDALAARVGEVLRQLVGPADAVRQMKRSAGMERD